MTETRLPPRLTRDACKFFVQELGCRVVANSGNSGDQYHIGKLILQSLKDAPDFVLQIDGKLNLSETCGSVLERSVRCALAFKKMGLQHGDVVIMMTNNHLDLAISFYAALYIGVIVSPLHADMTEHELKSSIKTNKPKLIICEVARATVVDETLKNIDENAEIITMGQCDNFCSFKDFLDKNAEFSLVDEFKAADLDTEESIAVLTMTSGTTGLPKSAALTHKNLAIAFPVFFNKFTDFPTPFRLVLLTSPLLWLTGIITYLLSPILRCTRLQSPERSIKHISDLINKYRPTFTVCSPYLLKSLITAKESYLCDLTCFDFVLCGGSFISENCMDKLKKASPHTQIIKIYGMSEITGIATDWDDSSPPTSIGKPSGHLRLKIVDTTTLEEITEPFVTGELWVKGPTVFKGYYNKPEETKKMFSEDGWLRSGDLVYRNENHFYYYIDRLKILLKYKNHQISPLELENVIMEHPGVADVAVVGMPDEVCGELPVAFVVKAAGNDVTAQDIKDIVKDNLMETKHLRGGVIFLDQLPMGATTKCDRVKLKQMLLHMERE